MRLMSTEEAVSAFYRDRLTNDPELLRDWFTNDAFVSLNGSGAANTETPEAHAKRRARDNPDALTRLCNALVANWHWHSFEVLQTMAVGDRAASRVLVDITFLPTGRRAVMEFAEFIEFDGERITEMIAFVDTEATTAMQAG